MCIPRRYSYGTASCTLGMTLRNVLGHPYEPVRERDPVVDRQYGLPLLLVPGQRQTPTSRGRWLPPDDGCNRKVHAFDEETMVAALMIGGRASVHQRGDRHSTRSKALNARARKLMSFVGSSSASLTVYFKIFLLFGFTVLMFGIGICDNYSLVFFKF
ncbi:hypothetical protein P154DRAFT_41795 [Amniculicola lignicola CBS 123094]|uniref:Uncharacterized protein n=1 Tax=Amniculicola lignicola CBS 123094 TaxID=1392246 RepID=A0A6A5WS14_9PLEO|nr:hypothetical protein P154DRAFT_41795 [Amniculicola lignicola CBS 123094]